VTEYEKGEELPAVTGPSVVIAGACDAGQTEPAKINTPILSPDPQPFPEKVMA